MSVRSRSRSFAPIGKTGSRCPLTRHSRRAYRGGSVQPGSASMMADGPGVLDRMWRRVMPS